MQFLFFTLILFGAISLWFRLELINNLNVWPLFHQLLGFSPAHLGHTYDTEITEGGGAESLDQLVHPRDGDL